MELPFVGALLVPVLAMGWNGLWCSCDHWVYIKKVEERREDQQIQESFGVCIEKRSSGHKVTEAYIIPITYARL